MENVVEFQGVEKTFDHFKLKELNLKIKKGYITGFIGPNGSGKTTTLKLMMQLLRADQGRVTIFGQEMTQQNYQLKDRIGFVYAENVLYKSQTVAQIGKLVSRFYSKWDQAIFDQYIEKFNLPLDSKVDKLSTGMKTKLSLALALSHHAELIILDEPTSGLDPVVRRHILDVLFELIQDEDKTIFFSSHITQDIEKIADYIIFIKDGEIIFDEEKYNILERYKLVKGPVDLLDGDIRDLFISIEEKQVGFTGLTTESATLIELFNDLVTIEKASLDDIMVFFDENQSTALNEGRK